MLNKSVLPTFIFIIWLSATARFYFQGFLKTSWLSNICSIRGQPMPYFFQKQPKMGQYLKKELLFVRILEYGH